MKKTRFHTDQCRNDELCWNAIFIRLQHTFTREKYLEICNVMLHVKCNASCEGMNRNWLFKTKTYVHAADKHALEDNRMAKVEPKNP